MLRSCFFLLASCLIAAATARADFVPASNPLFLGSVLDETWDTRFATSKGYIDGLLPLSDVDLTVNLKIAGPVALRFDTSIYPPNQPAGAGPIFEMVVDGVRGPRVTVGPKVSSVATAALPPGRHRVRFVASSNQSSPRWSASSPQLARVTGVELPAGAVLEKSQRPASWFLAITDSIGEGTLDMNTTTGTWRHWPPGAYTDCDRAWPAETARLLQKSVCGYLISGIGIVHPGTGVPLGAINPADPSGKSDPWDHIFEGVPRPFTTAPDFIILCVGTNENGTDINIPFHGKPDPTSPDAPFAANVETFFAHVRSHPQLATTPIYVSIPFDGCKRTALQKAVADYRAKHPEEKHVQIFDVAFGSPALRHEVRVADPLHAFGDAKESTVDEWTLFSGLTKERPDDSNTVPSPEAADRTHPYAIATPAIHSVNAHGQLAEVIAPRLAQMLKGGVAPLTGSLEAGTLIQSASGLTRELTCLPATGGSAAYTYQFQVSDDAGKMWVSKDGPIRDAFLHQPKLTVAATHPAIFYRVRVTDSAEPPSVSYSEVVKVDR